MTLKRLLIMGYAVILITFILTSGILLYMNFTFDQEYKFLTETVVLEVRLNNLIDDIHTHLKRLSGYYSDERRKKLDRDIESFERILESLDTRVTYEDSLRIYNQVTTLSNNYVSLSKEAINAIEKGKKDTADEVMQSIDKIAPSLEVWIVKLIGKEVEYLHKRQGRLTIHSFDSIRIAIVVYGVGILLSIALASHFFKRITGFINRFNKEMHSLGREHELTFVRQDQRSEFGFLIEEYKLLQERILDMKKQKEKMEQEVLQVEAIAEDIKEPMSQNMSAISTLIDMTEATLENYQTGNVPNSTLETYLKDMIWGLEVMLGNEREEHLIIEHFDENEVKTKERTLDEFYESYEKVRLKTLSVPIIISVEDIALPMAEGAFREWNDMVILHGLALQGRKKKIEIKSLEGQLIITFKGAWGKVDEQTLRPILQQIDPWHELEFGKKYLVLFL